MDGCERLGAGGVLPLIQMQVPPGNYSFAYTTNAASLPLPGGHRQRGDHGPELYLSSHSGDGRGYHLYGWPVVLLADYAISSSSAVWSVAQTRRIQSSGDPERTAPGQWRRYRAIPTDPDPRSAGARQLPPG